MALLYFVLYLLAFLCFLAAAATSWRRLDRPWVVVPLGLAAWVLVSVIVSGRALR